MTKKQMKEKRLKLLIQNKAFPGLRRSDGSEFGLR